MSEKDAELLALIHTATTLACCLEGAARILEGQEKVTKKRSYCGKQPSTPNETEDDIEPCYLVQQPSLFHHTESFLYMDDKCFNTLLNYIEKDVLKMTGGSRESVQIEKKLSATLKYLATGDTSKSLSHQTNIIEICQTINKNMSEKYLQYPTKRNFIQIANSFEEWTQFPNCIGALGTKHIQFNASRSTSHLYLNNQGFHSLVLFAVADTFGKFLLIDVENKGNLNDDEVLENSILTSALNNTNAYLPEPIKLENGEKMPFVFVADNEFPCTENILTPYQSDLTVDKEIFNETLFRALDGARKAFSALTTRFGVLKQEIVRDHVKTATIIKTCCILHNFLIENNPWYMQDITTEERMTTLETNVDWTSITDKSEQVRRLFKEHICKNEKNFSLSDYDDEKPNIVEISKTLYSNMNDPLEYT